MKLYKIRNGNIAKTKNQKYNKHVPLFIFVCMKTSPLLFQVKFILILIFNILELPERVRWASHEICGPQAAGGVGKTCSSFSWPQNRGPGLYI